MKLLFSRKQSFSSISLIPLRLNKGPMFTLWAMAILDADEEQLLNKYNFKSALLIADDWVTALRRAFRISAVAGFLAWLILAFVFSFSWSVSTLFAILITAFVTGAYYNEVREQIYVSDIIHGRKFRCFSIVELTHKEEYLKGVTNYLRQVLESAKHWGGQEAVDIPPLSPAEARSLILKAA